MSGLRKRMRRKLLTDAARQQRKETAGQGRLRRPVNSWVQTTKVDLVLAYLRHMQESAQPTADPSGETRE